MSDILQRIVGADKLVNLYGYWPSFSDGFIMWIKMECKPKILPNNVSVEFLVHALESHYRLANGSYKIVPDCLIHFTFSHCAGIELYNFSESNMLSELKISVVNQPSPSDKNTPNISVVWSEDNNWFTPAEILVIDFINTPSRFYGGFKCYLGEVVSIIACDNKGVPLQENST